MIKGWAIFLGLVPALAWASDSQGLQELKERAVASHSARVVIYQNQKLLADWNFGQENKPIELMSALKSVVAIAVGRALQQGHLKSLDQPVYEFFPEWNQGRKKSITLRHLLNHTSGLQNHPNAGKEIYPSPDAIQLALAAELDADPGSHFAYNNKAVNLLAGIFSKATGKSMDRYFEEDLFPVLEVGETQWYRDPSGQPHAMAGLQLDGRDLAKFGLLILQRGVWNGERLLSETFLDQMLGQGQDQYPMCGLLWWRLPDWERLVLTKEKLTLCRSKGVPEVYLNAWSPLVGQVFTDRVSARTAVGAPLNQQQRRSYRQELADRGIGDLFEREYGEVRGYYAEGYLGQFLVIIPQAQLVAVRQVERSDEFDFKNDTFGDFPRQVLAFAREFLPQKTTGP